MFFCLTIELNEEDSQTNISFYSVITFCGKLMLRLLSRNVK